METRRWVYAIVAIAVWLLQVRKNSLAERETRH